MLPLQFPQKLCASVKVAIYDQSVNLAFIQPRQRPFRHVFNSNIHLQATENAFQDANFLPVARNHHRRKCHVYNLAMRGNTP